MSESRHSTRKKVLVGTVIAALTVAAVWLSWGAVSPPRGELPRYKMFFVDENTGQEVVGESSDLAPITGPDGRELVQGVFMSCDNGQTKSLVYMIKYSPEAKEVMKRIYADTRRPVSPAESQALEQGTFYRLPQPNSPWVPHGEAEGIRNRGIRCGPGQTAMVVRP